jgi:hypothetical protein
MSSSKLVNLYNNLDFQLPTINLPYIYKANLFIRELDPIILNKERTVTIKCSQPTCG